MRPTLHFTSPEGWINDPHGITFRDGQYEAFYQYVPGATVWGPNCHWGHAVGPDLLSLRPVGVALAPGDGDDGIWTGCIVTGDDGRVRMFYTATTTPDFGIGRIRVAVPRDDAWSEWVKGGVVCEAPPELALIAYRDPFVRRFAGGWEMFVGGASDDGTAMALRYTSDDLETWVYQGIALERSTTETDPVWMGALWECPQIVDLDGRAVMVSSVWDADVLHYAGYATGAYRDGVFTPDGWGRLTHGDSYYAPSLFTDADGRPCLTFWMRGFGGADEGWAGAHSVPYLLELRGDRVVATPHPDVAHHRRPASGDGRVAGLAADVEWSPVDGAELEVSSGDQRVVSVRANAGELEIDIPGRAPSSLPVVGDVRMVIDGPVLEVSSAGGLYGAAVAPAGASLAVVATGGRVAVFALH